ncbi:MAG: nitronate monooxygenase [Chitinophagaceae bacterium]|nr:MAG: nitronate monooxygenase [Chitinophagaceae bacterium]
MQTNTWKNTKFTTLAGVELPIVQGPFGGGFSSVALTAAVSNFGGLGSFGAQPYNAAEIVDYCKQIRANTDKPFNINLWISNRDERLKQYSGEDYKKLCAVFRPWFEQFGVPLPDMPTDLGPVFEDQIQGVLDSKPAIFSFVYGIPPAHILDRCRSLGIKTVGNATTVDEAIALEAAGVDAIVATGLEAGGHRVSFLKSAEESLTGTFSLIPQVADAVSVPVIAAGGIADVRGMKAAFILGAHAIQMGTAFLATDLSNATQGHKERLFTDDAKYTTLTKIFSGRLARGFTSVLTEQLKIDDAVLAPYPMQGRFISQLRAEALKKNQAEFITLWSGQSAPLLRHRSTRGLLQSLVEGMET